MLTGEYLILDGALALASPAKLGQHLEIKTGTGSSIDWVSEDANGEVWFKATFSLFDFSCEKTEDEETANILSDILRHAVRMNPDFLATWKKYRVRTKLEFDRQWGLGSSSTLISLIAQWAEVNPYQLLFNTIDGSGYDVACAERDGKILYQMKDESISISETDFDPPYKKHIYFAYSGEKTSSSKGIDSYKERNKNKGLPVDDISKITEKILKAKSVGEFSELITKHEAIVSDVVGLKPIKETRFSSFPGAIKSLGAWGGDFFMFVSEDFNQAKDYFNKKGIDTIFKWDEILV